MEENLLTRKEAAKLLKVKPDTVAKWEYKGIIKPHCWFNKRPRYRAEDLNVLFTPKPPVTDGK